MTARLPHPEEATKPRLLDLFCKAGGAARGYQRAGFYVVGVDIEPQPRYAGDEFIQADALTFPLAGFDAVHASPPCQANVKGLGAVNRALGRSNEHVNIIIDVRERLCDALVPFVIENVEGAALLNPHRLCGSSFGLPIRRHRLFESNVALLTPQCEHDREREKKSFGLGHNATSPRLSELLAMELVSRTTERRKTRQGKSAFVHVISNAGRRALARRNVEAA